ncbi:sarcoplasmic reticulum histidine-rich calcium-binding protein-like isoform X1 [Denticeps clupeoides]|uniref:sarcoplasmic reticulum histidine-rich calcium-binding protein-like isoform X1 n=1 Tax=Denticeps clupeoides TaxID=299321 RepID=UPI0010A40004|nr:sarcoplasmic reticulum histidine-rich calcium-binding protein-like isoform X1 [Denticeps clupeoides]
MSWTWLLGMLVGLLGCGIHSQEAALNSEENLDNQEEQLLEITSEENIDEDTPIAAVASSQEESGEKDHTSNEDEVVDYEILDVEPVLQTSEHNSIEEEDSESDGEYENEEIKEEDEDNNEEMLVEEEGGEEDEENGEEEDENKEDTVKEEEPSSDIEDSYTSEASDDDKVITRYEAGGVPQFTDEKAYLKGMEEMEILEDSEVFPRYHTGSLCGVCSVCEHCSNCDKCPCKEGEMSPLCHHCQLCPVCSICPAVCDTVCTPGGFIDEFTGLIYKMFASLL